MVRTEKYVVDPKTGRGTLKRADKDDEPFDKDGNDNSPRIPQPWGGGDWAGKKKKKSKKA